MKTFRKYFSLYLGFFRASLAVDLEFRANFLARIVTDIFWYLAQVLSFELIFNFTDQIGGWSRADARVFLGVLFVIDAFIMITIQTNLDNLSESVRKGSLDLLLSKPVNSQFMVSLKYVSTAHLGNLLLGISWLAWACAQKNDLSIIRLLWLLPGVPCGVIIYYSFRFPFNAVALLSGSATNLQYLFYHIYRLGMRPDNIYPSWLKYTVLTILPMGLIASVPTRLLLGTASWWLGLWAAAVAAISLWGSTLIWKSALRRYSSASS